MGNKLILLVLAVMITCMGCTTTRDSLVVINGTYSRLTGNIDGQMVKRTYYLPIDNKNGMTTTITIKEKEVEITETPGNVKQ